MNAPISHAAANHALLRERLANEFGLDAEDQALADTLDGISDFKELAIYALREARRREGYAEAIKAIIAENRERQKRHDDAATRIRNLVAAAMMEAGEKKIEAADMTVTLRDGKRGVVLTGDVPVEYCTVKETFTPNKTLIREAIEGGDFIPFAELTNAEPILTVRGR